MAAQPPSPQEEWDSVPKAWSDWWDADRLTQTNPFTEDTPAYWALEGWKAAEDAQRRSQAATATKIGPNTHTTPSLLNEAPQTIQGLTWVKFDREWAPAFRSPDGGDLWRSLKWNGIPTRELIIGRPVSLGLEAAPVEDKKCPLEDPELQSLFGGAIQTALQNGFKNESPPASDWLASFWNLGREEAEKQRARGADEEYAMWQLAQMAEEMAEEMPEAQKPMETPMGTENPTPLFSSPLAPALAQPTFTSTNPPIAPVATQTSYGAPVHPNQSTPWAKDIATWMAGSDTCDSSKTLALIALGAKEGDFHAPYDCYDLGSCIRLVKKIPQIQFYFPEVSALCPAFHSILDKWTELTSIYMAEAGEDGEVFWSDQLQDRLEGIRAQSYF